MDCRACQLYLHAHLDNELDAALSMEVQQHLDHCARCLRDAAIEQEITRRLKDSLAPTVDPDELLQRVLGALPHTGLAAGAPHRLWGVRRWLLVVGGLAAVVILVVGGFPYGRPGIAAADRPLAEILIADHVKIVATGNQPELATHSPARVQQWVRDRLALAAVVPSLHGPDVVLLGVRKCSIKGRPAAVLLYRQERTPISMLIFEDAGFAFDNMKSVEAQQGETLMFEGPRHNVLARRKKSLVYCLVSQLSCGELMRMWPS